MPEPKHDEESVHIKWYSSLKVSKPNQVDDGSPWWSKSAWGLRIWTWKKTLGRAAYHKVTEAKPYKEGIPGLAGVGGGCDPVRGVTIQAGYGGHPTALHRMSKPEEGQQEFMHKESHHVMSSPTCGEEGINMGKGWQWEISYIKGDWTNKKVLIRKYWG